MKRRCFERLIFILGSVRYSFSIPILANLSKLIAEFLSLPVSISSCCIELYFIIKMSNNGLRRNNSSCGTSNGQFQPYMLGKSRGFGVNSNRMPQMVSVNTVSAPPPQQYAPPMRTSSLNSANTNVSVRDCMYWPTSLNNTRMQQARNRKFTQSYPSHFKTN